MNLDRLARRLTFAGSILALVILIFEWSGGLDRLLKIPLLDAVASGFELSYGPEASRPIRPSDKKWAPTIKLIREYTRTKLPTDRQPLVIARYQAVLSAQEPIGKGQFVQWTAPSTPIVVLYKKWPGNSIAPEDYRIVGTIGDLRSWINEYRDKWKFYVSDLLFAILALITAALSLPGAGNPPTTRQNSVSK